MSIHDFYQKNYGVYEGMIKIIGHERSLVKYLRRLPLQSSWRVLDAGCGSGAVLRAITQLAREKKIVDLTLHGFDFLEPAIADLQRFGSSWPDIRLETQVADVRQMNSALPPDWRDYNLIVSSGMLEYLPKTDLPLILSALGRRLAADGQIVIFISRTTFFTRFFLRELWKANTYSKTELNRIFATAGLRVSQISRFKTWGYVVQAGLGDSNQNLQ